MEWTLEELFQDIDTNNDGQISMEEFRDAFTGRRAVRLREKLVSFLFPSSQTELWCKRYQFWCHC
jgi:Ca2+-binding EF-hand superfamily protein